MATNDIVDLVLLAGLGYLVYQSGVLDNLFNPSSDTGTGTGPVTPSSNLITSLSNAIAQAEGFNVSGSIPQRQNNPGDLTSGGVIATYPTAQDGWNALYAQVQSMFDGTSSYYNPGMTLAQVGNSYAGGDPNWANNVASALGVSPDTTLAQLASMM